MLRHDKSYRKRRLPEYEMTPEIKADQSEAIDAHYDLALRHAFVSCGDPRADIFDIVEASFAHLIAGWMLWEASPREHLLRLVEEYSVHALRRLPACWDPEYWYLVDYVRIFRDVATPEEMAALRAIAALDEEDRRLYEARRVYGWTVRRAAERTGINRNSVGSMTSRIEQRLERTDGASAQAARDLFNRYMQEGGG